VFSVAPIVVYDGTTSAKEQTQVRHVRQGLRL
jgi:hypothetical protein